MGEKEGSFYLSDEEREAAMQADRDLLAKPLPGADQRHYSGPAMRQAALEQAGEHNTVRHASELGVPSAEYLAKKKELGRTPTRSDFQK